MDDDDRPVGRILSRREILALVGGSSVALLVACTVPAATSGAAASASAAATAAGAAAVTALPSPSAAIAIPSCIVRPALTEGPYFVDEKLDRSDIRTDPSDGSVRPGTPLVLTFNVSQVTGGQCASLAGAVVDVWHCDAAGVYSDVADPGGSSKGKKFLRGYQTTPASGLVTFVTIYPGWYQGRAVHIHFKIRSGGREFTSQLFFEEAVNDVVFAQAPYARAGQRLRNDGDSIHRSGGDKLLLTPGRTASGYTARFDIGLA